MHLETICVSTESDRLLQAETLPTKYGMLPDSCMMNIEKADVPADVSLDDLTPADKWILSKVKLLLQKK